MNAKRIGLALGAIVLAVIGFIAVKVMTPPPADLDLALSKASRAGHFRVSIAPETGKAETGKLHNWIATVTLPDGKPVEGADITIDGGMPQHGHGLPTEPKMTASLGEGRYKIEGVRFNMGGWWEFRLSITAAGMQDVADFNLVF